MIERNTIQTAYQRIQPYIRQTPVINLGLGAFGLTGELTLKLELLQHAGSFKARGAFNRILTAQAAGETFTSVVAASGGNHGVAVAHAAQALGFSADIFVPSISPAIKQASIRVRGATVHVGGDVYADALAASERFLVENAALSIHAYNHRDVMAGQGTVALEWAQQSADLDTVLVAVGGGGLIGGMCSWYQKDVQVIAVEPETSCALHAARQVGNVTKVSVSGVAVDSLGASTVGELAFAATQAYLSDSLLVPDAAIQAAQKLLWEQLRIAAEPGGATTLAALLAGVYKPSTNERVGVLICGGNVDAATFV